MYSAVSQFIDPEYTTKTLLLPGAAVTATPRLGTVLADKSSEYRRIRDYMPLHADCPDVFAWHIPDVLLTDDFIVHDGTRIFLDSSILCLGNAGRTIPELLERFSQELSEAGSEICGDYSSESALVIHHEGGETWGHFLVQSVPKILLYLQHYPSGKIALPRGLTIGNQNNFARLFELYGIAQDRLLALDRPKTYAFRELVLLDFLYNFDRQVPHPQALALLGNIRSDRLAQVEHSDTFCVKRPPGMWNREIANGIELDKVLEKFNITSGVLGVEPIGRQVSTWRHSKLIISTLGSDLANIVFGFPGQRILCLSPDWFGDTFFYNLAVMKGCEWHELRCGELVETAEPLHKSSFNVNLEMLDVMLETLSNFASEISGSRKG
jgi:hypothetical protein